MTRGCGQRIYGIALLLAGILVLAGCAGGEPPGQDQVVIYTSLDQRLSEPVLDAFEEQSGIEVRVAYDTEATKTAGLVNRLLAEQESPQADVFWNSKIVRTIVLKRAGVLTPYESPAAAEIPARFKDPEGYWTGFAGRVRVIGINTSEIDEKQWPRSFDDLLDPVWSERFAIAYPLFGTTSFHVAALFALEGEDAARSWLARLQANGARVVNGNSTARDLMVAGNVPVCFTDSDDVAVALARGEPVDMVIPSLGGHGVLLIPNTVAMVQGGPNPEQAKALIDYLLSPEVEEALAKAPGAQIPLRSGLAWPDPVPRFDVLKGSGMDYGSIADHLEPALEYCRELFVR